MSIKIWDEATGNPQICAELPTGPRRRPGQLPLRNIGPGPALNVRIAFRLHSLGGYQTEGCELGPLRAGEVRGSASEPLHVPVFLRSPLQDCEFAQIPSGSWEMVLTYEDIFEQRFYSMHPKHPHQMNCLRRVPGSDKFEAPQQPWVTLGKGEPPAYSGEGLLTGFVGEVKPTARQICIRILQQICAFFSRSYPPSGRRKR